MDLSVLFSFGNFLLAFLSLFGFVFNALLKPIKEKQVDHRNEFQEFKKEVNIKLDKLLSK